MRYHCSFLQDIIYNFRNSILLSQGYKVSPLLLLKNGCKSQKPFWTQIQQQSGIDAIVPIMSTANMGLHFGPICRAYVPVIDTVCFDAGWIDKKYDIMVLFLELFFHLSHGPMYCAFENGVRMFIQKDFNVKNDMLSAHKDILTNHRLHLCHHDINPKRISGYRHHIYMQLTSWTHLYAIIHSPTPQPRLISLILSHYML